MKRHHPISLRQSFNTNTIPPRHIQSGGLSGKRVLLIMLTFAAVLFVSWAQCSQTRVSGAGTANLIFALSTSNQLLRFSADAPGTLIGSPIAVSGLVAGDTLVGIDFRPATGQLYSLGVNGANARLYIINPGTGAATQLGGTTTLPQSVGVVAGADYGFDFNPTVDRIRVVADSRDNFRLNPINGAVAGVDTALTAGSVVVGAAYDRNFAVTPQPPTTLFGIDANTDQLVTIGGVNGAPSPNTGMVLVVGNLGVNTSNEVGFDIAGDAPGSAYASLTVGGTPGFYTINLATGAAQLVGTIGNGSIAIRDITVAPGGVLTFLFPTNSASETAGLAQIRVTRTGGSFGAASVTVSTADGTATAGQDYAPTTVRLEFAEGVTSAVFSIPVLNDALLEGNETVILNFSNYSGCGRPGPSGLLTITDDEDGLCPIWAIDSANNLLRLNADTPALVISATPVTGLQSAERLVGIDFRPATGQLYAMGVVGVTGRLYTLNLNTAAATLIGPGFALPQSVGVVAGGEYGFDFNPTVDRIRVVADSRDNFRLNPDTGTVAGVDTALTAGAVVTGAAYDRNFAASPQPATTLYGIDANTDQLVTIGGINSVPSPNTGMVFAVGNLGFNAEPILGFDISNGAEGTAYALLRFTGVASLFTVNLGSGAVTPIGGGIPFPVTDIAVAPAGAVQFSASAYLASESSGPATITVTRTGGDCCGSIRVTASTSNGTATAPADYAATTVTLNFPEGVTSQTFTVPIVNDSIDEAIETINLTLSANIGGRITAPATATLTITDDVTYSISDPLACTGPGNVVTGAFTINNSSAAPTAVAAQASLPAGLLALPGTCAANVGSCSVVNASTVTYTATLAPGQTATVTYKAQVGNQVAQGAQLCSNLAVSFGGGPALTQQACITANCPAPGPGVLAAETSELSDQKAGSVLIYNIYTSNATSPESQNTRINLTNIDPTRSAIVKLFFVDGATCSVADSGVCLTPNQTVSFQTSDLDPGGTGYLVAVAVDSRGCPVNFNNLIGDAYVKFSSGHAANLAAEGIAAIAGGLPSCNENSDSARLNFDGISYNRIPRLLALDNIPSRGDGNDTMLILNRIGGDLRTSADRLGPIFGVFYDDTEVGVSFTFNPGVCQFRSSVTNNFPRITPRFETFVPAGRSGWFKLSSTNDQGILGAAINFAGSSAGAFNQGHNLHKLTLTSTASFTIPVFPPNC
ncbi:MAG TPA: DUF4394 domain-containing protein [Blastocatellia bacterium]|nr:DUF4394 domain-containing protein [Blastocatellia bacterium]